MYSYRRTFVVVSNIFCVIVHSKSKLHCCFAYIITTILRAAKREINKIRRIIIVVFWMNNAIRSRIVDLSVHNDDN